MVGEAARSTKIKSNNRSSEEGVDGRFVSRVRRVFCAPLDKCLDYALL